MRWRVSSWVFYSLWIVTIVGIAGVYWIINAQESVTEDLSRHLQTAEQAVQAGDYRTAADSLSNVTHDWPNIERIWALHTMHEELDPIGDALLEAEALVLQADPSALAALRIARNRLQHLPKRDRLLLSNLL